MFAALSALALLIGSTMAVSGPPEKDAVASATQVKPQAAYVAQASHSEVFPL